MTQNRLNIVSIANSAETEPNKRQKTSDIRNNRKEEVKAKFERLWLLDPKQFDPMRNCMQRERIDRTLNLFKEFIKPNGKLIADLGCGSGILSKKISEVSELNTQIHAADIASNALKLVNENNHPNIKTFQEYLPRTLLTDDAYDVVISTDVIAYLNPDEYRLYFSELSRLMNSQGYVICSTPIDIKSEDSLQRFAALAETEFSIEKWILSYHSLHIKLYTFLKAPEKFARAIRDPEFCQSELNKRKGFSKYWFRINSGPIIGLFWRMFQYPIRPLLNFVGQNRAFLLGLESISNFIWDSSSISHAIFIGKRRPLVEYPKKEAMPEERRHKKQVWE